MPPKRPKRMDTQETDTDKKPFLLDDQHRTVRAVEHLLADIADNNTPPGTESPTAHNAVSMINYPKISILFCLLPFVLGASLLFMRL